MSGLASWASTERTYIKDDLKWLKAGGKVLSPSGEDITARKIGDLEARLEHANKVIAEHTGIPST